MDAIKFLKEKRRMCHSFTKCSDCTFSKGENRNYITCYLFGEEYPEEAVEVLEAWRKDNPLPARKDKFAEAVKELTNEQIKILGIWFCDCNMPGTKCHNFNSCELCKEYWSQEYEGDGHES